MITGHTKTLFQQWVIDNEIKPYYTTKTKFNNGGKPFLIKEFTQHFHKLPVYCQFGTLQLFADSLRQEIRTRVNHANGKYMSAWGLEHDTRAEAMTREVEEFNRIVNEKH